MILESLLIVALALLLDFTLGDPKNKYHPTAWIGKLVAKLVPFTKNNSQRLEKLGGIALVLIVTSTIASFLVLLGITLENMPVPYYVGLFITVVVGGILLKTTIAIRGMERHTIAVLNALERENLDEARTKLALIVKRDTKGLDKNHILSGVLESVSENTVDGVTGSLFYFALFGLAGAFVYRTINTIDAMVGYKTSLFKNVGWFGANCDKVLNYIPARLTGLVMILSAMILGENWKMSYQIMRRDGKNTESPNAGYPMAALAGALGTRFEKINHYSLGEGRLEFSKSHVKAAIKMMNLTSILFCAIVTVPIIVILSYLGWWIHA
jgi:adenosylcobinamide-phosphate synthase